LKEKPSSAQALRENQRRLVQQNPGIASIECQVGHSHSGNADTRNQQ
jgi:hypothetical protein